MISSCGDNPVVDEHDHHEEAVGLRLLEGDSTLLEFTGLNYDGPPLTLLEGEAARKIQVEFIGEDGDYFTPEDSAFSLAVSVADTTTVTVSNVSAEGDWTFDLSTVSSGTTAIEIDLIHGGHSDYISPSIPLEVQP